MSEGSVRQWYKMFNDRWTNVHKEKKVVDHLQWMMILTNQFVEDSTSQFQNFRVNFHKFHALFSEII
jgi:hypothetical protein